MKKALVVLLAMFFCTGSLTVLAADHGDKDKKKKKSKKEVSTVVITVVDDEPVRMIPPVEIIEDFAKQMVVKVFNARGEVTLEKKVSIETIFSNNDLTGELLKNSTFVMYHDGVAYYFTESEG